MEEKVIIHNELETECVIDAINTHRDPDALELFTKELQEIPPELMEKVYIRLYEEGFIKKMLDIMREVIEEETIV